MGAAKPFAAELEASPQPKPTRAAAPEATSPGAAARPWRLANVSTNWRTTAPLFGLWLLVVAITAGAHGAFLSEGGALAVSFNMIVPGTAALGVAIVAVSGGLLDLSVGVSIAGSSIVVATMERHALPVGLIVLAALAFGAAVGIVNALLVTVVGLNPIIATMATSLAGTGLLSVSTINTLETLPNNAAVIGFSQLKLAGVPVELWLLIVLGLGVHLVLTRTVPGRHAVAVGGNRPAAASRGISVRRVRVTTLIASGTIAGLAGIFLASQSTLLTPVPDPELTYQIAAVVLLGGVSIAGGRGNLLNVLVSLLLLSTLPTVIVQFGASSAWEAVLEGVGLFVAVSIDAARSRAAR